MILVKSNGANFEIKPTIFPDGTSQVWKLPLDKFGKKVQIIWYFEQEAELIHLNQLVALLFKSYDSNRIENVFIPYLPYARQDKLISNESTFALRTFLKVHNIFKNTWKQFIGRRITPLKIASR